VRRVQRNLLITTMFGDQFFFLTSSVEEKMQILEDLAAVSSALSTDAPVCRLFNAL